jgi:hypothetical protein
MKLIKIPGGISCENSRQSGSRNSSSCLSARPFLKMAHASVHYPFPPCSHLDSTFVDLEVPPSSYYQLVGPPSADWAHIRVSAGKFLVSGFLWVIVLVVQCIIDELAGRNPIKWVCAVEFNFHHRLWYGNGMAPGGRNWREEKGRVELGQPAIEPRTTNMGRGQRRTGSVSARNRNWTQISSARAGS